MARDTPSHAKASPSKAGHCAASRPMSSPFSTTSRSAASSAASSAAGGSGGGGIGSGGWVPAGAAGGGWASLAQYPQPQRPRPRACQRLQQLLLAANGAAVNSNQAVTRQQPAVDQRLRLDALHAEA
eukprot:CAMPEP_0175420730 /NCGR_PEP_ID=MMETSP0095-20121207/46883_1 /TAXON_ID=311494 /ORGANISM="Alexandrium monilatum, Strain CCMP3105" /LENGTH=126 /DNA_ID=CAMNT_0016719937 /DNA_START=347 /DNA_END=722 /DNA_ORIENTATION=+